jgi:hypothetical protein
MISTRHEILLGFRACSTHGGDEKCIRNFNQETRREEAIISET